MVDAPVAALPRRMRQTALLVHVIAGVSWLGAITCLFALALAGQATGIVTLQAHLVPVLAVATIVSGMVLSLGTRWGLVRHWWVIAKTALALLVIGGGIVLTGPHAQDAVSDPGVLRQVITSTGGHVVALGLATGLSVFKPRGATRWSPSQRKVT